MKGLAVRTCCSVCLCLCHTRGDKRVWRLRDRLCQMKVPSTLVEAAMFSCGKSHPMKTCTEENHHNPVLYEQPICSRFFICSPKTSLVRLRFVSCPEIVSCLIPINF